MSKIEEVFKDLRVKGRKAFIPYIMAGDPDLAKTEEVILLFEEVGADIVELGIPFTDPLADGPTIQRASERALKKGITLKKVLEFVKRIRRSIKIPIVLMTYYNPIFKYGVERFVKEAVQYRVNGIIVPDLPPDEATDLIRFSKREGLDTVFLLAPTSTEDRVKMVARTSSGFIYYVSITGITGARLQIDESLGESIKKIRKITDKPVCVGFGVSNPEEASRVSEIADGVIIGSAIVKMLNESPEGFEDFVKALRKAI